jgi:WD40 repeat protein
VPPAPRRPAWRRRRHHHQLDANECVVRQSFKEGTWLSAFAFSPDSSLLAIATRSSGADHRSPGSVRAVDTRSGAIAFEHEYDDAATCLTFHPSAQVLVSGHVNGRVLVRNYASGDVEQELQLAGAVNTVTYSPDATRLVNASQDGFVRMTLVGQTELLAEAERRLMRTLTPAERLSFVPELALL